MTNFYADAVGTESRKLAVSLDTLFNLVMIMVTGEEKGGGRSYGGMCVTHMSDGLTYVGDGGSELCRVRKWTG